MAGNWKVRTGAGDISARKRLEVFTTAPCSLPREAGVLGVPCKTSKGSAQAGVSEYMGAASGRAQGRKSPVINILPPKVYNLLSAGEVVENPASVVKELAENAIDADAAKITVEITNGGIDEIVVTDNGTGCPERELPKVFLPHATSKIADAQDIDGISSLGFRGEAMASISAVSRAEFTSKPVGQEYAVKITNSGKTEMAASGGGTTVKISNLFYNTPARRKFLKSGNTERNNVTAVIHNIIFSHPTIHIKYTADNEKIIDFHGRGLLNAIEEIYGVNTNEILPVDFSGEYIKIGGYISNVKLSKKNKTRQVVIVNGRVVDGGIVAAAANEIMSNYLMVGEYPIFVLTVEIDTAKIDVNVHPQKREIRFADREAIANSVKAAVIKALDIYFLKMTPAAIAAAPATDTTNRTAADPNINPAAIAAPTPSAGGQAAGTPPKNTPPIQKFFGKSFDPDAIEHKPQEVLLRAMRLLSTEATGSMVADKPGILNEFRQEKFELPPKTEQTKMTDGNEFRILGQVFETYLLVSTAENLLIIDQHAMAERINFDKFKRMVDENNISSQPLLTPEIIKLTPREQNAAQKIKPHLISMGFDIDEFGIDCIRISAIPSIFTAFGTDEFMRAVLSDRELQTDKLSEYLRDRIATMACKASIRAGDIMTDGQIASFIANYQKTNIVPLCPHGRPIMLVYSKSKTESLFGRK
jgi:DNA mismatch repair protein MutL